MKSTKEIKVISVIILVFVALSIGNVAMAKTSNENQEVYESLLTFYAEEASTDGNVTYPAGVTKEMTESTYWSNKATDADKVLMTKNQIRTLNSEIVEADGTNVVNLENVQSTVDAGYEVFKKNGELRQLYINGEPINQQEYLDKFEQGNGSIEEVMYAVAVKRANIKCWPTNDLIGYSATDADDETQLDALNVNDPVVVRDVCVVDGITFYYCQSKTCSGWVNSNTLAVFDSKEEWTSSWKYDLDDTNILVVKESKITLEPSARISTISEVQLMLGTILKLVPEDEIPRNIGERGTWFNYVVYLPTRDDDGKYVQQYALISQRYNVSIGFSDMTQSNILEVAFSCLGDRYGWGSMLGAYDCSAYTKAIYKCFGLEIPRNTTWQQKIPGRFTDISKMTDEEKQAYFESIPAGSLVYFPGHAMMYIGTNDGVGYVISDTGSLSDSEGDVDVRSMYTVIINPLTVRRGSGKTWLNQMAGVITFGEIEAQNNSDETQSGEQENENSESENQQQQSGNSEENPGNRNEKQNSDESQENNENRQNDNNQPNDESIHNGDNTKEVVNGKNNVEYEFMNDESTKVIRGYKIQFKCDIEYANFSSTGELYIDGQLVNPTNYTVSEGCTLITLNDDYANTLSIGNHTVRVAVSDGAIIGSFEILNDDSNSDIKTSSPKAGDHIIKYVVLLGTAVMAILYTKSKNKKSKK